MGKKFGFNDLIIYKGKYWVSSNKWNGLYCIDGETKEIGYIQQFPGEKEIKDLYMRTALYKSKIVFAPSSAEKVAIYDIDNDKMDMLKIENEEILGKFHDIVIYDRYAFLIAHRYPGILKIDMETYDIQYLSMWIKDLYRESGVSIPGFVLVEWVEPNIIWLPQYISNVLMEFNLQTSEYKIFKINEIKNNITGIAKQSDNIYLLSEKKLYKFNRERKLVQRLEINSISKEPFYSLINYNGSLCFFPIGKPFFGKPVSVDLESCLQDFILQFITKDQQCYFSCIRKIDDKVYLSCKNVELLIIYDLPTKTYQVWYMNVKKFISSNNFEMGEEIDYENLITLIKNLTIKKDFNENNNEYLGTQIWKLCKEEI